MPPVYLLTAAQCPPIQVPAGYLDPQTDAPTSAEVITPGTQANDPLMGTALLGRNATRIDAVGRYGGGAWAVGPGLDFASGGGLTLRVNDGVVILDSAKPLKGPGGLGYTTQALSDSIYSTTDLTRRIWIWLSRALTLLPVNNSTVAPAGGPWVLLGSVRTTGGAQVDYDFSGRLELRGSTLYRKTADIGPPTDNPPASVRFWNETLTGLYFWTGSGYLYLGANAPTAINTSLAALLAEAQAAREETDDLGRKFRALLLDYVTTFKRLPTGLADDFSLATREA